MKQVIYMYIYITQSKLVVKEEKNRTVQIVNT